MTPNRISSTRRSLILGGMGAAAAIGMPQFARAANAPIKIALVTSLSGPFSSLGESMRAGLALFLAENGNQMGGRPVQLLIEDDHGKPDEAVRKVRKLVGQDRVDVICGVISAAVALAIRDIVTESKTLTFIINAAANALAREAASPYIFRTTKTSWMLAHPAALWTHEHVAKSGGITLASDYAAGREYVNDFADTYQKQGGSLGRQFWTPLGTTDFAPMLMNVASMNPAFIYAFLPGADAVRFLKQMKDFRLQDKIRLVGPGALFDQEDVLPAAGDAGLGGLNAFHQSPGAPASASFVAAYGRARNRLPGEASTSGYTAGQVIKAGIDAVSGDVAQRDALKQALLEKPVDTAFGPMRFDPRNNQAILDIYINEVKKGADGKPFNTVLHTYPGIQDPGPGGASK
ncbi:MAG: ABC transporter substrate-binding protein [Achromobacter sp.]